MVLAERTIFIQLIYLQIGYFTAATDACISIHILLHLMQNGTVETNVKRLIYSTMAHNDALMELESLREQYGYINEKLNKQSLINEKMISETIRTKINRT